jgi:mono/diheme cytochrome c family protein
MRKIGAMILLAVGLASCESKEEILYKQYVVEGRVLYQTNCANCHQENGSGLKDLYPAISQAALWKSIQSKDLTCLIKWGRKGTKGYMPGNTKLQALDIAEIQTFLREQWGPQKTIYSLDSARFDLKACEAKL